ncbi:MAG: hypothetical protein S0880_15165 [Actinomycetota bacterium]|nr:hypothetical protein [Actinomycetota bacterium]
MDGAAGPDLGELMLVVDAHAAEGVRRGRLSEPVVAALRSRGMFKLFLPADLGGAGLSLPDAVQVIARVAEGDGAAGWALMIGAGPNWFAGWMAPELATEVFGPTDSVVAGSGALGDALAVDGGWSVTGEWRWCSGAPWASWFTFSVLAAQEQAAMPIVVAVPADEVEVDPDSWDTVGLRGTASWTARLTSCFVPSHRTFGLTDPAPVRDEAIFSVPFASFAQATMAAVSVGLGRRLVREFVELAEGKVPMASDQPLSADRTVQLELGRSVASLRAAERYFADAVEALWQMAVDGADPRAAADELRLASTHAVSVGGRAALALREHAGMSALVATSPIGRVMADLDAVTHNAVVSTARIADAGDALIRNRRRDS